MTMMILLKLYTAINPTLVVLLNIPYDTSGPHRITPEKKKSPPPLKWFTTVLYCTLLYCPWAKALKGQLRKLEMYMWNREYGPLRYLLIFGNLALLQGFLKASTRHSKLLSLTQSLSCIITQVHPIQERDYVNSPIKRWPACHTSTRGKGSN